MTAFTLGSAPSVEERDRSSRARCHGCADFRVLCGIYLATSTIALPRDASIVEYVRCLQHAVGVLATQRWRPRSSLVLLSRLRRLVMCDSDVLALQRTRGCRRSRLAARPLCLTPPKKPPDRTGGHGLTATMLPRVVMRHAARGVRVHRRRQSGRTRIVGEPDGFDLIVDDDDRSHWAEDLVTQQSGCGRDARPVPSRG